MDTPTVSEPGKEHQRHDDGGRDGKRKMRVQRSPELRLRIEVIKQSWINQPSDDFQAYQGTGGENKEYQVDSSVQMEIATPESQERAQEQAGYAENGDL